MNSKNTDINSNSNNTTVDTKNSFFPLPQGLEDGKIYKNRMLKKTHICVELKDWLKKVNKGRRGPSCSFFKIPRKLKADDQDLVNEQDLNSEFPPESFSVKSIREFKHQDHKDQDLKSKDKGEKRVNFLKFDVGELWRMKSSKKRKRVNRRNERNMTEMEKKMREIFNKINGRVKKPFYRY